MNDALQRERFCHSICRLSDSLAGCPVERRQQRESVLVAEAAAEVIQVDGPGHPAAEPTPLHPLHLHGPRTRSLREPDVSAYVLNYIDIAEF